MTARIAAGFAAAMAEIGALRGDLADLRVLPTQLRGVVVAPLIW
jgi:hypothetical protein